MSFTSWAAGYARYKTKDAPVQETILKKLVSYDSANHLAWFELGIICENRGDMKCYMDDMVRAGNLGSTAGQNNIGYFYKVGQRGLPRDLEQARQWLTLAANQGYIHSQDKLSALDALIKAEAQAAKK